MFEKANYTNLSSMELAQKSLCLPNERIVYLTPGTCRLRISQSKVQWNSYFDSIRFNS